MKELIERYGEVIVHLMLAATIFVILGQLLSVDGVLNKFLSDFLESVCR